MPKAVFYCHFCVDEGREGMFANEPENLHFPPAGEVLRREADHPASSDDVGDHPLGDTATINGGRDEDT
jgi:hypothetical protein